MSIENLRDTIDLIDEQILELFLKRIKCCEKIAELKINYSLPILNEKREEEVIKKIELKSPKYSEETKRLFLEIMSICRGIQYKIKKGD